MGKARNHYETTPDFRRVRRVWVCYGCVLDSHRAIANRFFYQHHAALEHLFDHYRKGHYVPDLLLRQVVDEIRRSHH